MKFTGERFIVGQAVGDITVEHLQRYKSITHIVKGKKVLDAACGEGYGSNILSQYAASVIGIDISNEAITYAKEHYKRDNLKYICASIENISLEDHSIDVIVSFETIEHVNADLQEKFLQEIKRVLKPDGILIMSSPDKKTYSDLRNYNNIYHVHELYKDEFEELLKKHFQYIKLFSQGMCNQRIGVIKSEEDTIPHLLSDINIRNKDILYFIAICSMFKLKDEHLKNISTVLPSFNRYPARIFFDKGRGFSEQNTILAEMKYSDEQYSAHFDFRNIRGIHKLRFDPIEDCICTFKILSIDSNIESLIIKNINARINISGKDYFMTVDPQYKIEGNYNELEWIEIKYEMEIIFEEDIINYINYYEEHCKRKEEKLEKYKVGLQKKNEELEKIKASKIYKIYHKLNYVKKKFNL